MVLRGQLYTEVPPANIVSGNPTNKTKVPTELAIEAFTWIIQRPDEHRDWVTESLKYLQPQTAESNPKNFGTITCHPTMYDISWSTTHNDGTLFSINQSVAFIYTRFFIQGPSLSRAASFKGITEPTGQFFQNPKNVPVDHCCLAIGYLPRDLKSLLQIDYL